MERTLNGSEDEDEEEVSAEDETRPSEGVGTKEDDQAETETSTEKKKKKRRRRKKKTNPSDTQNVELDFGKDTTPSTSPPALKSPQKRPVEIEKKKKTNSALVVNIDNPANTVYVGNLPFDATEQSISNALKRQGDVDKVHVVRNNKGRGAGFAYVTFQSTSSVKSAIQANNITLDGRDIRVKKFDPASLYRRTGKRKEKRRRVNSAGN